jgi:hypothetical protein
MICHREARKSCKNYTKITENAGRFISITQKLRRKNQKYVTIFERVVQ